MPEIKRFGVVELPKEFVGTNAERLGLDTTNLQNGSTFYEYDTQKGYIWADAAWRLM